jgi:hypothetical protein
MKRIENIAKKGMMYIPVCPKKQQKNSEYFVSGRRKLTFDNYNSLTLGK